MPLSLSSEQPNSDRTHSKAVKALVIPLVNSYFPMMSLGVPQSPLKKNVHYVTVFTKEAQCYIAIVRNLSFRAFPRMMFNLLAPPVLAGLAIHLAAARTNHGVMALLVEGDGWVMKVMK